VSVEMSAPTMPADILAYKCINRYVSERHIYACPPVRTSRTICSASWNPKARQVFRSLHLLITQFWGKRKQQNWNCETKMSLFIHLYAIIFIVLDIVRWSL